MGYSVYFPSINIFRTLACESTLGFDSPIWTLHAPLDSDLNVFWIGCRDGSVIKTARKSSRIATARVKTPKYEHEGLGADLSRPSFTSRSSSLVKAPLGEHEGHGANASHASFASRTSSGNRGRRASLNMPNLTDVGDRFF
jgi:hypothetical protein